MLKSFLPLLFILTAVSTAAQENEWLYFRPSNTGVAGGHHTFLSNDPFGNVWTTGRVIEFSSEGSVVRMNIEDTLFTCWSNFEGYFNGMYVSDAQVDQSGVLWVAAEQGLSRIDNNGVTHFDMNNTPLPTSNIRSIDFDSQGNVWIAFQDVNFVYGGIASFNGINWNVYTPENSDLPDYQCLEIIVGPNDVKWVHSLFYLSRFENGIFENYNSENSPIGQLQLKDICLDNQGRIGVVTSGAWSSEIAFFDGVNWIVWDQNNTPILANNIIHKVEIKGDHIIMAGYNGGYVVLTYDGTTWNGYPSGDVVYDVLIDDNNRYWAAGISSVSYLSDTGWRDYTQYSAGLSENFNENIFMDSHNHFWAANGNGGAQVFNCPKWQSYGPFNQGLYPSPQELSTVGSTICEDSEGNIWFAYNSTQGTVVKIPNGDYQNYEAWVTYSGPMSWVEESVADGFGNVFFYSDYSVYMYNNDTDAWVTWNVENSPLLYYTDGFGVDNAGIAYFGGWQQIAYYENGMWEVMSLMDMGADIPVVNDIAFDALGNMWIGGDNGLWKWNGSEWINWNMGNSSIHADHITSIEFDANGKVWISGYTFNGFVEGGVAIFDEANDEWSLISIENSLLPSEQIDDILFDENQNLWINAYPRGIAVYNPNGLIGLECVDLSLEEGEIITSVESIGDHSNWTICYPNPTRSSSTISVDRAWDENGTINIIDIRGKVILQTTYKNYLAELDASSLNKGIYAVVVSDVLNTYTVKWVID